MRARAYTLVQTGMFAEAVAEVVELAKTLSWNDVHWYNFACIYSLASTKIKVKKNEYEGLRE